MKCVAQIKELLNNGMHSKCLFHFVAENKKKVGLICVRSNSDGICKYEYGDVIPMFGFSADAVLCGHVELREFYALMIGTIHLPSKLKLKEIIL